MESLYLDRTLVCSDCHAQFIFTADEQLFFSDKQFKNDPKRCKPCKGRRSGLSAAAHGVSPVAAGISRIETRTECSECGMATTVPFKPTQGRPVLCRHCFQIKARSAKFIPAPVIRHPGVDPASTNHLEAQAISALTGISANTGRGILSADAAVLAVASMAAAPPGSSIASVADLASISAAEQPSSFARQSTRIPSELIAASSHVTSHTTSQDAGSSEAE